MEERSVDFASSGPAGLHRETRMGRYSETSQIVQGCPVFEQVEKQEDEKQYFLFVGPDGCWRVGPDVSSYSGSVLKNPKKKTKLPPKTGWLYYLDEKWRDAEALRVTVNVRDRGEEEVTVKFVSNGAAGESRKAQLGDYTKTNQMIKDFPVFEQVQNQEGGKQYFLFIGPDGCWRVGPDVSSYSGSVLKNPKKNRKIPPKAGWLYYLDEKWNKDESLQLMSNNDEPEGGRPVPRNFNEPILEEYRWEYTTISKYGNEWKDVENFENVTQLQVAILDKDIEAVKANFEKGCNVNFDKTLHWADHMTPLIMACRFSSLSVVSLLLDHPDIDVDLRPYDKGENALSWAVRTRNNLDMVKHLVDCGADINLRDSQGFSHLHRAVEADALDIVEYLYSVGASINTHGGAQKSPLWSAVSEQNMPMVRFLISHGARMDSPKSFYGFSPFHLAVKKGNLEIIRYMISEGADVTVKGNEEYNGKTNLEIAKKALEAGDYDEVRYEEIISLLKSAEESSHKFVEESIVEEFELPENPKVKYENISSLGISIIQKDIEEVAKNLKKGCNINFCETDGNYFNGDRGWTPLMLACEHSTVEIVKLLCEQPGIIIDATTKGNEESALSKAVQQNSLNLAQQCSRRDDNLDMVKVLVEAGADPDMRCRYGYSHLHRAAEYGQLDVVKYLQSKGAWISTQDNGLTTPLWIAAHYGKLEMVKYLASQGANLNEPRAWLGYFPLNTAVAEGNVDVVRFLIEQGADIDKECESFGARDNVSRSSLEIARERIESSAFHQENIPVYEEIISILKEAGAKESGYEEIKEWVLDCFKAMIGVWMEKIDLVSKPWDDSWAWPNNGEMSQCIKKLEVAAKQSDSWFTMIQALVEEVPSDHPLGPMVTSFIVRQTPMQAEWHPTNVDTYLKVLELTTSLAKDDSRHQNISTVLAAIAGDMKRFWMWNYALELFQGMLTQDMLDYLFSNLEPGSGHMAAIFSLLTLELLTSENEPGENPNVEKVRKRFMEFGPEDHPLLRLEKLKDSDSFEEKQVAFCAQWYLDHMWCIDNKDARCGKTDSSNINTTLIPSKESEYLKIDPTGLEIRCDGPWYNTASSSVRVSEGAWYYEVTIITSGLMQIGWGSSNSQYLVERGYGVGDDEYSQAYEGCRQLLWYNKQQPGGCGYVGFTSEYKGPDSSWKAGDVVGCLLDIDKKELVFTLNGVRFVPESYILNNETIQPEPSKEMFDKVTDGFYAAVSLMSFQHCQVNFGSNSFKHPPEGTGFKALNEAA